jgi:hypothetical protein
MSISSAALRRAWLSDARRYANAHAAAIASMSPGALQ